MSSSASTNEIRSRLDALMDTPVGEGAMTELDIELTPILAELMTLEPGNNQHPTVRQLFNWLVDPQRTVEEFIYVIGPLANHVYNIMDEQFKQYVNGHSAGAGFCICLDIIATEALAVKKPVLEGQWELIAWLIVLYTKQYTQYYSHYTSAWIISIIGDADICPNVELRIEFMLKLHNKVLLDDKNRDQALDSVMSACSELNNYLGRENSISNMKFSDITSIFEDFEHKGYLLEFDKKLATKLMNVKTLRLSTLLNDFSHQCGLYPNKYTEPSELHTLIALLTIMAKYAKKSYIQYRDYSLLHMETLLSDILIDISHMLKVIICNFKKSCQMPQLLSLASSCIMDVMELVLLVNLEMITKGIPVPLESLQYIDHLLLQLAYECGEGKTSTSPLGREIVSNYSIRLRKIVKKLKYVEERMVDRFGLISNILIKIERIISLPKRLSLLDGSV